MKFYLIALMLFLLSGCASQYVVTFDSNPKGASLVCSGTNWGHTPRNLYYDESVKKLSTINVSDCSANWVSGARESYPSNLKVFPQGGTIVSVDRPSGDGYAQDAGYALQLRQTEAAESAVSAAIDSANEAKSQNRRQNNKITTCYTNYGVTTCY